jgi:hypothetical protein
MAHHIELSDVPCLPLHGQALVWFHKIAAKSVSYFKELSRLFLV